jgi:hypothetical protein
MTSFAESLYFWGLMMFAVYIFTHICYVMWVYDELSDRRDSLSPRQYYTEYLFLILAGPLRGVIRNAPSIYRSLIADRWVK